MAVGSFDPSNKNSTCDVNSGDLAEFSRASQALEAADFGLDELAIARLAAFARHAPGRGGADWALVAESMADTAVVDLIRLFTLAESRLLGWEAGAKSPVVALAALLRQRDAYPKELTTWIKANTNNRFLPYGSLMDRL
jgi:hypothetical protein